MYLRTSRLPVLSSTNGLSHETQQFLLAAFNHDDVVSMTRFYFGICVVKWWLAEDEQCPKQSFYLSVHTALCHRTWGGLFLWYDDRNSLGPLILWTTPLCTDST